MKVGINLLTVAMMIIVQLGNICYSQNKEGVITYQIKTNLHRNVPEGREHMKSMIPEFRLSKVELLFDSKESLSNPVIEDEVEPGSENRPMRMGFGGQTTQVYLDIENFQSLSSTEFMGKQYLIEDTLKMAPWKFGTETKDILGYSCRQAFLQDTIMFNGQVRIQVIVAWYTSQIRPFLGPENFNTLPGAILELNINDDEKVISAIEIDLKSVKKSKMGKPTRGTKVTKAEYKDLVIEQMKKFRPARRF